MALSYEYSIGSVRAKETSLFSKADLEQFLGCASAAEFCALLRDKGYGSGDDFASVAEDHMAKTWAYLKRVAPDFAVFTPFLIQNDVHNFKVILKGTMSARDYYTALLLSPSTVEHDVMTAAVEHRDMRALPEWLRAAAEKNQLKEMLRFAQSFRSAFLKEYINTTVFYNNVKIALRAARTGADKNYLKAALVKTEGFDRDSVIAAAVKGSEALKTLLQKTTAYGCRQAMEAFKTSPSDFEKFVDDRLMALARESCKRASEGAEPLLGYYLGTEAEKKVLHIIFSGIKTGTDRDIIRERLREIYG